MTKQQYLRRLIKEEVKKIIKEEMEGMAQPSDNSKVAKFTYEGLKTTKDNVLKSWCKEKGNPSFKQYGIGWPKDNKDYANMQYLWFDTDEERTQYINKKHLDIEK